MHLNEIPGISENDFLFLTRPDWVIKKQLREVSTAKKLKFSWCYFKYYRKALSIEKQIEILRKHLNKNNAAYIEKRLSKIQQKFISSIKKYVEQTRTILNIKD